MIREEVARSREELGRMVREQRSELAASFSALSDGVAGRMQELDYARPIVPFSDQLTAFT